MTAWHLGAYSRPRYGNRRGLERVHARFPQLYPITAMSSVEGYFHIISLVTSEAKVLVPSRASAVWATTGRSLTSQVIGVAFYSERKKCDKFCSKVLISAWGSFKCRKSTTRDKRLYFPFEWSHIQDFYALKKSIDPGRVWTREPRIQWWEW